MKQSVWDKNVVIITRAATTQQPRNVYEPYGLAVDADQWVVKTRRLHTGEVLAGPVGEVWSGIPIRFF